MKSIFGKIKKGVLKHKIVSTIIFIIFTHFLIHMEFIAAHFPFLE